MKKILLVIAAISVLALAGCKNDENVNNDVPQDEVNQEQEVVDNQEINNEEGQEEKNLAVKLDDSKDWVYDAEYEKNVVADSYTTEYNETYTPENIVVPFINIDSVETKTCNEEIKKVFDKSIEIYNSGVNDKITYVDQCSYDKYINNDVLSVVLTTGYGGTDVVYPNYHTYNIGLKNGNKLSYKEICSLTQFSVEDIEIKIKEKIENEINKFKTNMGDADLGEYIDESIKNYNDSVESNSIEYFLDSDLKLNIVVKLSVPAGSGEYNTIITID